MFWGQKFDARHDEKKKKLKPRSFWKNDESLNKGEKRLVLDAGLYSAPWPPLIDQWPAGGSYNRTKIPLR